MTKKVIIGIENEFELRHRTIGVKIDGKLVVDRIIDNIKIPYFRRSSGNFRLATGGSFYIDGNEPEITTAPYLLEKGAVTAVATNLVENRNVLVDAINVMSEVKIYQLDGYSAHYHFTTPQSLESEHYRRDLSRVLALTVNPALQLLVENRHSSGVMFRYRADGRIEICADYISNIDDIVTAVGFQAGMLTRIDDWVKDGATIEDVQTILGYKLLGTPEKSASRPGYTLKTPDVIKKGRKAVLEVENKGKVQNMTAQELL